MNLNKLKQPWRYFKVVNGLERIERQEILSIINSVEKVDYQVNRFVAIPNSVVFGFMLLFFQSC